MIGKKLVKLLKENKLKQKEVGQQFFNMSSTSFSNKLRDAGTRFNINELIKIADILNLKLALIDKNEKPIVVFDKNDIIKKDTDN